MNASSLWLWILVPLLLFAWWWARTRVRRGNLRRLRRSQRGEREAERLLARHGYEILDRQVTQRWHLSVDGHPKAVHSRADLLVQSRRSARRYVAEVKTGRRAPDPTLPATRRQLMEYLHVFPVDGVLLVDSDAGRIHRVRFPR